MFSIYIFIHIMEDARMVWVRSGKGSTNVRLVQAVGVFQITAPRGVELWHGQRSDKPERKMMHLNKLKRSF